MDENDNSLKQKLNDLTKKHCSIQSNTAETLIKQTDKFTNSSDLISEAWSLSCNIAESWQKEDTPIKDVYSNSDVPVSKLVDQNVHLIKRNETDESSHQNVIKSAVSSQHFDYQFQVDSQSSESGTCYPDLNRTSNKTLSNDAAPFTPVSSELEIDSQKCPSSISIPISHNINNSKNQLTNLLAENSVHEFAKKDCTVQHKAGMSIDIEGQPDIESLNKAYKDNPSTSENNEPASKEFFQKQETSATSKECQLSVQADNENAMIETEQPQTGNVLVESSSITTLNTVTPEDKSTSQLSSLESANINYSDSDKQTESSESNCFPKLSHSGVDETIQQFSESYQTHDNILETKDYSSSTLESNERPQFVFSESDKQTEFPESNHFQKLSESTAESNERPQRKRKLPTKLSDKSIIKDSKETAIIINEHKKFKNLEPTPSLSQTLDLQNDLSSNTFESESERLKLQKLEEFQRLYNYQKHQVNDASLNDFGSNTFSLQDIGITLNAKGEVTLAMPDSIKDIVTKGGSININFDVDCLDSDNCLKFKVTEDKDAISYALNNENEGDIIPRIIESSQSNVAVEKQLTKVIPIPVKVEPVDIDIIALRSESGSSYETVNVSESVSLSKSFKDSTIKRSSEASSVMQIQNQNAKCDSSIQVNLEFSDSKAGVNKMLVLKNAANGFVSYPRFTQVSGSSLAAVHKVMKNVKKGLSIDRSTKKPTWFCSLCHLTGDYGDMGPLFGPFDLNIPPKNSYRNKNMSDGAKNLFENLNSTLNKGTQQVDEDQITIEREEVWLHEDCLCWSPGVYMIGFDVYGLEELFKVARFTVCCECGEIGASLGCFKEGCSSRYHFQCSVTAKCKHIKRTFTVLCPNHSRGVVDNCLKVKPFRKVRNFLSQEEIDESENLANSLYNRKGQDEEEDREKAVKITKTKIIRSRINNFKEKSSSRKKVTKKTLDEKKCENIVTTKSDSRLSGLKSKQEMHDLTPRVTPQPKLGLQKKCENIVTTKSDSRLSGLKSKQEMHDLTPRLTPTQPKLGLPAEEENLGSPEIPKSQSAAEDVVSTLQCPKCPRNWSQLIAGRVKKSFMSHTRSEHCENSCFKQEKPCSVCEVAVEENLQNLRIIKFSCFACDKHMSSRNGQRGHLQMATEDHRDQHIKELATKFDLPAEIQPCFGCGIFYFGVNIKKHLGRFPQCNKRYGQVSAERAITTSRCLACDSSCRTRVLLKQHLLEDRNCMEEHTKKLNRQPKNIVRICFGCGTAFNAAAFSWHIQDCSKLLLNSVVTEKKTLRNSTSPLNSPQGSNCFKDDGASNVAIQCPFCSRNWCQTVVRRVRASVLSHMRTSHCHIMCSRLSSPCDECTTIADEALKQLDSLDYPCYTCGKSFKQSSAQAHHLRRVSEEHQRIHLRELDNSYDIPPGIQPCYGCGVFYFQRSIRKHMIQSPECCDRLQMVYAARTEKEFKCLGCDCELESKEALIAHLDLDEKCTEEHALKLLRLPDHVMRLCFECGDFFEAAEFPRHLQDCLYSWSETESSRKGEFQCFGCGDKFKKVMALNRHVKQDSCKLKHIQQHLDVVGNEVKEWTVCYGCAGYFKSSRIGAHLDKKRRCVLKHFEVLRDKKGSTDAQMNDLMEEYAIEHLQELIGIDPRDYRCFCCQITYKNSISLSRHLAAQPECKCTHISRIQEGFITLPPDSEACLACGSIVTLGGLSKHFVSKPGCKTLHNEAPTKPLHNEAPTKKRTATIVEEYCEQILIPSPKKERIEEDHVTKEVSHFSDDSRDARCFSCQSPYKNRVSLLRHLQTRPLCKETHITRLTEGGDDFPLPPNSEGCFGCGSIVKRGGLQKHFLAKPECVPLYQERSAKKRDALSESRCGDEVIPSTTVRVEEKFDYKEEILDIPTCLPASHSSLETAPESPGHVSPKLPSSNSSSEPLQCSQCDMTTRERSSLLEHFRAKHCTVGCGDYVMLCTECAKALNEIVNFPRGLKGYDYRGHNSSAEAIQCPECSTFSPTNDKSFIKKHYREEHCKVGCSEFDQICSVCVDVLKRLTDWPKPLVGHNYSTGPRPAGFKCPKCNKSLEPQFFKRHYRRFHCALRCIEEDKVCKMCHDLFRRQNLLTKSDGAGASYNLRK